jgi:glutamyl-Q tRNA(Asp) synthetase
MTTPPLLTRFAPAPTGLLHLGHVVNAIFVWGLARRLGASTLLRIEDHDAQRSRRAFETQLLDDLDWLGFVPDRYPTAAFRAGRCESRQSDRHDIYQAAATSLMSQGRIYGCICSRQAIAQRQVPGSSSVIYPGTCRDRQVPIADDVTWRVRMDAAPETFVDLLHGPTTDDAAGRHGDLAIRDRHGNWTYGFAVVVDDMVQHVNLVIRGDDLYEATAGQINLGRMLGRTEPARFAHHAVIMKSATQKLSKSDGDTGIGELRRQQWPARRVIGHAAALAGLIAPGAEASAEDAAALVAGVQLAIG